jgi:hypothetical protein
MSRRDTTLDTWLAARRSALDADLAGDLDIETGLQEVLISSRHAAVLADVAGNLNVEAGLAAIAPAAACPLDLAYPDTTGISALLRPHTSVDTTTSAVAKAVTALPPDQRVVLRTHPITQCFDLAAACITTRDLVENLQHALVLAPTNLVSVLDQFLHAAPARDDVLIRDIAHARNLALARGGTSDHVLAADLVRVLGEAGVLVRNRHDALSRAVHRALERAGDVRQPLSELTIALHHIPAEEHAQVLVWLRDTLDDLVGADLREADLTRVPLVGIRWSIDTQWPSGWVDRIKRDSVPVEGADGIFVIRGGTMREASLV